MLTENVLICLIICIAAVVLGIALCIVLAMSEAYTYITRDEFYELRDRVSGLESKVKKSR